MTRIGTIALLAVLVSGLSCTKQQPAFPSIDTYVLGIREPETISAENARIANDELILGICVGSECRAYLVDALQPPETFFIGNATQGELDELGKHVVNDVVGGRPITVTHCDITKCSRVFTGTGDDSLDVAVEGTRDGQLQLSILGKRFPQNAVDAPLEDFAFTIATWGNWKSMNPDTDLYIGDIPNSGIDEQTKEYVSRPMVN